MHRCVTSTALRSCLVECIRSVSTQHLPGQSQAPGSRLTCTRVLGASGSTMPRSTTDCTLLPRAAIPTPFLFAAECRPRTCRFQCLDASRFFQQHQQRQPIQQTRGRVPRYEKTSLCTFKLPEVTLISRRRHGMEHSGMQAARQVGSTNCVFNTRATRRMRQPESKLTSVLRPFQRSLPSLSMAYRAGVCRPCPLASRITKSHSNSLV
mmetsp:Transcript_70054/g.113742  ORF Transcript_70054/g.113742 Transcript_70054/m.113742 type:complete len:208 (+) Transcript_70054:3703-4326(+)